MGLLGLSNIPYLVFLGKNFYFSKIVSIDKKNIYTKIRFVLYHILNRKHFCYIMLRFVGMEIANSILFSIKPDNTGWTLKIQPEMFGKYLQVKAYRRVEDQVRKNTLNWNKGLCSFSSVQIGLIRMNKREFTTLM
jgi:hypothetical protein